MDTTPRKESCFITRKRTRAAGERGAVLVMSTVAMVVAMIAAALAVDLGFLAHEVRVDQKVADMAALDAVRVLPADPTAAAQASATRNGFPYASPGYSLLVEWASDPAGPWTSLAANLATATNLRVTASMTHKNAFPFVAGGQNPNRKATARHGAAIATVRVGSSLATVSTMQSVLLNKAVSALVGGNFTLTAVGWQGLASGNVSFSALAAQLATVTGNSTFNVGTPTQVLNATFTANQLLTATAAVLNNDGVAADAAVATSVQTIGLVADGTSLSTPLSLYKLFDFGSVVIGDKRDVANARLNVLQLLQGGAIIADGDHFAKFDLAVADIVGPVIPGGFSGATVNMGLIEAPRQSYPGPAGIDSGGSYYTHADTSQIRVRIDVKLKIPLTTAITVPLVGSISVLDLTIPYYLDLGRAHAYLENIQCGGGATPTSVGILGTTEAGTANVGFVTDASMKNTAVNPTPTTGTLGSALLGAVTVTLDGTVSQTITGNAGEHLTFAPPTTERRPSRCPGPHRRCRT